MLRKTLFVLVSMGLALALLAGSASADNPNGKYALYVAGPHGEETDRCLFELGDCNSPVETHLAGWTGRWDVHVIAIDVDEISGARFGLYCEVAAGPPMVFYGWTTCSLLEIPTAGWPGCGEGNAVAWAGPQAGPHVVMGFFDVYVPPGINAKICTDVDPRVGFAEFCDGSEPYPVCNRTTDPGAFGCVGFNKLGYNPCGVVPVQNRSWGALKSLYR